MERIELSSPVWKTGVITIIRHPLIVARIGFEPIATLP